MFVLPKFNITNQAAEVSKSSDFYTNQIESEFILICKSSIIHTGEVFKISIDIHTNQAACSQNEQHVCDNFCNQKYGVLIDRTSNNFFIMFSSIFILKSKRW